MEADHASVIVRVDDWWSARRGRSIAARWWFRHAAGTSWIAEADDGRLAGFALGQPSPDDPVVGLLQAVAVAPGRRRRGVARALVERVADDLQARGGRTLETTSWPDDPIATRFLRAMGFRCDDGSGTMRLFGTPAFPDYEGEGEDRSRWTRDL